MAYSWIIFSVMLACCLLEASSRPSDSELAASPRFNMPEEVTDDDISDDEELPREQIRYPEIDNNNTQEILNKISAINKGLVKPNRKRNKNSQTHSLGDYVLDAATLQKIQQIIADGKLNGYSDVQKKHENNYLVNDNINEFRYDNSRALQYGQLPADLVAINQAQSTTASVPYITSIPVLVLPSPSPSNNVHDRYAQNMFNTIESDSQFQTRQRPPITLPFNINWPLAPFFPILVKDPLLGFLHGGGWNNFFEYGQNADVCNRKQKAIEDGTEEMIEVEEGNTNENANLLIPEAKPNAREARAIRKRNVSTEAPKMKIPDSSKKLKKFFNKPGATLVSAVKPVKPEAPAQDTKTVPKDDDLRFHMGGFSLFGGRPSVPTYNPGFFINKLKVRRGGVAIAGPGGVATAGKGGAAIVGPGGLAYTQPGGLAVAGPSSRVVALTSDVDLSTIVTRLQQQQAATDGGREYSGYDAYSGYNQQPEEYQFDGINFVQSPSAGDSTFTLFLKPVAHAVNGPKGTAIANPVSHVIIGSGHTGKVVFNPKASAVVGPGGIAHAQATVQYLPFYGGGKGQYLEVKTNNRGVVISEVIVSEEKISNENVVKNVDESLLSKVLAKNLENLQSLSSGLIKLHNLGRKTGALTNSDKERFRTQLASLGDAASNTIKLIDEVGDNVDVLFKSGSKRQYENDEEDVGEEGVGIESPDDGEDNIGLPISGITIAEAKPVGLAVIGENGLAASRPQATAVAVSGIALARPVATAIAGVNPAQLGIDFQVNNKDNKS
ncbi:uncharacterized protein LOC125226569 [Leguminivora glycinivorella]|uniref:uncharacterized protein LOC125226569 n=1 Tax=Leguminivora glycinivorella TaxID=1035111 RepID=UPI00200C07EC|nr:uncharacterized protein LOC125226569 [Leguminivora glycinivorella]